MWGSEKLKYSLLSAHASSNQGNRPELRVLNCLALINLDRTLVSTLLIDGSTSKYKIVLIKYNRENTSWYSPMTTYRILMKDATSNVAFAKVFFSQNQNGSWKMVSDPCCWMLSLTTVLGSQYLNKTLDIYIGYRRLVFFKEKISRLKNHTLWKYQNRLRKYFSNLPFYKGED